MSLTEEQVEALAELVDHLLAGNDLDAVNFSSRLDGDQYVEGFDEDAVSLLYDIDSGANLPLLRIVLALRSRQFELARDIASIFFEPLENLAVEWIDRAKAQALEDAV